MNLMMVQNDSSRPCELLLLLLLLLLHVARLRCLSRGMLMGMKGAGKGENNEKML